MAQLILHWVQAQIGDLMGQVDEIRDQTRALELEFSSHFKLSNDAVHRIVPAYLGLVSPYINSKRQLLTRLMVQLGEPCQDPRAVQVEIEGRKKGLKKDGELAVRYCDIKHLSWNIKTCGSFMQTCFSRSFVTNWPCRLVLTTFPLRRWCRIAGVHS